MTTEPQQKILIFCAGCVAGVLLSFVWFFIRDSRSFVSPGAPNGATSSAASIGNPSGAVSVSDQPAGSIVVVESVTVPPPGVWVAVEELVGGSALGNVLGATRARTPLSNISISLLRPTEANRSYAVVLYRDNGDDIFDLASDSVYVDFTTGERVVAIFRTKP